MSYCPKCGHEYAETVKKCIDCGSMLRPGIRQVRYSLELEDYLIPSGALVCDMFAILMLYLRVGSQLGWVGGPIAHIVELTQPPCMTVFYAVAVVASTVVFAWWFVQTLIRRQ